MKKVLCVMLALMLAVSMFSFASAEEDKPFVGILAPATTHGWVGAVAYFAEEAAASMDIEYRFLTSSDADEMSSQIEELIGYGVDAIVVWPQFTGVETAAEKALEKGIRIYNFDMIISVDEQYADNMYVLTGDNYGMGYEQGRYIAEKLEGKGKVVVMCKPSADNVNDERCKGFYDYINEFAPDIEVLAEVATDFNRETALADMHNVLTAYPEIDAVYSLDDETSIGVLQAIEEANRTDIKVITGGGGCQEYFKMILDEKFADMNICSATYAPNMIINCIENVVALLNGEEIEHTVTVPTTVVDKTNAEEFLNENSPY